MNGLGSTRGRADDNTASGTRSETETFATFARGSLHECLPRSGVSQIMPAFLDANRTADVTFVQLLGHGTQFEGRNHVRRADAKLQSEFDILSDTDPIKSVIKTIRAKSRASHVVIDACRDNPLAYAPPSSANRPYARRSGR